MSDLKLATLISCNICGINEEQPQYLSFYMCSDCGKYDCYDDLYHKVSLTPKDIKKIYKQSDSKARKELRTIFTNKEAIFIYKSRENIPITLHPYSQTLCPDCQSQTVKLVYSQIVDISQEAYDNPELDSWEGKVTINLLSQDDLVKLVKLVENTITPDKCEVIYNHPVVEFLEKSPDNLIKDAYKFKDYKMFRPSKTIVPLISEFDNKADLVQIHSSIEFQKDGKEIRDIEQDYFSKSDMLFITMGGSNIYNASFHRSVSLPVKGYEVKLLKLMRDLTVSAREMLNISGVELNVYPSFEREKGERQLSVLLDLLRDRMEHPEKYKEESERLEKELEDVEKLGK